MYWLLYTANTWTEPVWLRRKDRLHVARLFAEFPDADVEVLQAEYPDLDIEEIKYDRVARGHHADNVN